MTSIKLLSVSLAACACSTVFAAQGWRLFASDWDTNNVYEFDAASGQLLRSVIPQRADNAATMAGMAIGSDGAIYLTDFATNEVRRYNRFTGENLGVFVTANAGGFGQCTDLTFGPDGALYAASGASGGVLQFHGVTGAFASAIVEATVCAEARFMCFANGNLFVTDNSAHAVKRFDAATGAYLGNLACCTDRARGIVSTAWGELLVASWDRDVIQRFDINTGAALGDLVSGIRCNGLAIGPDGYLYACEAVRHRIERYDARTGVMIDAMGMGELRDPWQMAFALEPCPSDLNLDGAVDFFDYLDFVGHFGAGSAVADFNRDGVLDMFDYLDFVDAFTTACE